MAIIERDIVLMSKDENGNTTIDKPITRLANIEADADVKETLANGDFIPVIDSEDNEQIKMVSVSKLTGGSDSASITGLESDTATVTVNGNSIKTDVKLADYERNLLKKASWTTGLVVDKDDIDAMVTTSSAEGNIIEKKSDGFYATVSDEILNGKITNYARLDTVNEFNDGMILNKNVYIPNVGWFKMIFSDDGKITINTDDFGSENSYFQISANKGTTTFKQVVDNEFMELKFDQGANEIASNANISAPNIPSDIQDMQIEELSPSGTWNIDDFNLINQAVDGVIPKHKSYVCLSSNYNYEEHGTLPEEDSWGFRLEVNLIYSANGVYVVKQDWFQSDHYHYTRYYDTYDNDGWTEWKAQFTDSQPIPTITTSATTMGLHRLCAGTADATTSNCPVGCWYGKY